MSTFTKEQLIARIERQIDINATIIERLGDSSAAASELAVETATMDIKILDVALAVLKSSAGVEPVYQLRDWHWFDTDKRLYEEAIARGDEGRVLYTRPQPAPATVIKSSQALYEFYCKYNEWLQSGNGCFNQCTGLCINLFDYCYRAGVESEPVLEEMHAQFKSAGLDEKLPFNCSSANYQKEQEFRECHKNDSRRKWVKNRVNDGMLAATQQEAESE